MESSRISIVGSDPFVDQTFSIGKCHIHVKRRLQRYGGADGITDVIDISDHYIDDNSLSIIQSMVDSSKNIKIRAIGAVIEDQLNLDWKHVDGFDARFSSIAGVHFNNTIFTDVVNLAHGKYDRLEGIDADFDRVIYFDYTNVHDLNLRGSSGSRGMFFQQSRFEYVNMRYLKARDKINLSNCIIDCAIFDSCDLNTSDFHCTRFNSVSFECSVFREWTQFRNMECSEAVFRGALFHGRTSMSGIHIEDVIITDGLFESGLSMEKAKFESFQLSRSILRGTIQIGDCPGSKMLFDECNIECEIIFDSDKTDVDFMNASNSGSIIIKAAHSVWLSGLRNNGKIYVPWKKLRTQLVQDGFDPQLYRMLRENYRATGHPRDEEGVIRDQHEIEMNSLRNVKRNASEWMRFVGLRILKRVGSFGTDPKRPILASIAIILIFSMMYTILLYIGHGFYTDQGMGELDLLSSIGEGLIVSLLAFISLGFTSKIYPYSFDVSLIVCIEGFVAFFILTYYTVILSRKITD